MSGPVTTGADDAVAAEDTPSECDVEVVEPRVAEVGGFEVRRVLPRRGRRMVGAWCFADQMGPGRVDDERPLDVGPHPHIGLQTVTWLLDGALLHRDSLGSEQLIRPGQLNLMTAGHGVSHSEETTGVYAGALHGVQLWVAQPSATRNAAPGFEHHAELPHVDLDGATATVFVGDYAGVISPARCDTRLVGVELALGPDATRVPLDPTMEHAVLAVGPTLTVGGTRLEAGQLGYLGIGRSELVLDAGSATTVLLLGGAPFDEELLMWWNYVARERSEIIEAHEQWSAAAARFGQVTSPVPRIDVPGPPWSRT